MTISLVCLFALLYLSGLSAVGLFRSVSWFAKTDEPFYQHDNALGGPRHRKGFTLIELLVVIAIIAVLLALIGYGPGEAIFMLIFGWIPYLWHLATETVIDWENTTVFVVCLAALGFGSHRMFRWLYAQRSPAAPWAWRWTASIVALVVLAFLAGISVVGVVHESVWLSRYEGRWFESNTGRAAANVQSRNNLKQMAIAALNYDTEHKHLPPGGTFDGHGQGLHGWQTFLLPYVEHAADFKQIDLEQPWNAPHNLPAMQQVVWVYVNAIGGDQKRDGFGLSHYAGNVHVLGPTALRLDQIRDGTSNTLLAGEVATDCKPWGHPANWRDPARGLNVARDGFGRPGGQFVQCVFVDGSVRRIADDVSPQFLKAISTPAGGEPVVWED
jgi:prepilin-type N-terminal cleavage/methylation domain-containing protein